MLFLYSGVLALYILVFLEISLCLEYHLSVMYLELCLLARL